MMKHIPPDSFLKMIFLENPLLYWDDILFFFEEKVKI